MLAACAVLAAASLHAGGIRWVTGTTYFNRPGVPIAWAGGQVLYYTDQGPLSASVDNATANAMVAAAAAPWSAVVYSTVNISAAGTLAEDVSGANTYAGSAGVVFPQDAQSSNIAKPLAIIYDTDGSITDLMLGQGASDPESCWENGVTESVDNMRQDGAIVHALLVLNGRCTGPPEAQLQMQYQLERMFGRVLGLDWSQLSDNVFTGVPAPPTLGDEQSWPLMHPIDIRCGPYAYQCMVDPFKLRMDDRAALGRLYPVTHQNLAQYPGKKDIWLSSIGVTGNLLFADGQPMEGVNLTVRYVAPYIDKAWPTELISMVTGPGFRGDAGNPVTGYDDASGNRPDRFGSASSTDEGSYSTLGMEETLQAPVKWESIYIASEPINPLYTGQFSVGPYTVNQVLPSGQMPSFLVVVVADGSDNWVPKTVANSAADKHLGLDGTESAPAAVPSTGFWTEQLATYGHTGWYGLTVRANRTLTVETVAVDELGEASTAKAMPVIGVWSGSDPVGTAPDASAPSFNGVRNGSTTLAASTAVAGPVRIAIADQRGDGRPDFTYQARVLYADSLAPAQVGTGGGTVTLTGMGFRAGNVVLIGGVQATINTLSSTQIVLAAPPLSLLAGMAAGAPADVTVSDPGTGGSTTMSGALTYGSGVPASTDQLIVVSGGNQVAAAANTLAPVLLEVTDGNGHAVPNSLVQVYQTVTGYKDCAGHGRCAAPPLLGTANTAEMSDANGMVSVDPLQIADRAQTINIVATAESQGLVRVVLAKHP